MSAPNRVVPSANVNLAGLAEHDLPELANFVAAQSGREPGETLSHLTWLLLENPARGEFNPLGCGVRSSQDELVGCILYLPQMFVFRQNPLLILGSTCFYVDKLHRGSGGALFLKFARAANQFPLFGNSANAIAAQLWKARGATRIPNSNHELLGVVDWPPVVEELAVRCGTGQSLARAAGAATGWLRHVRKLRLPSDSEGELVRLSSVEEVLDLTLAGPPDCLTARRDEPYIRWRYFSRRDPSVALFAFRNRRTQKHMFVAVNERPRGYRRQIRSLNVLDAFPKPAPVVMAAILAVLYEKYRGHTDMIVLRCLDEPCQAALREAGFHRRNFEAPNGWLLDRQGLLPTQNRYFVPADGDWLI
ncbi:MAG: hypothetical protein WCC04_10210 [Terriglobales bacterium]